MPVLLIVAAGVLDLGRLYYAYVAVTDAAAEGVAYAAINPPDKPVGTNLSTCPINPACNDPQDTGCTCQRALDATGGLIGPDDLRVQIIWSGSTESGDEIGVSVSYNFELMTPFLNAIVPSGMLRLRTVVTETIIFGRVPES
jgi:hypothetical protein